VKAIFLLVLLFLTGCSVKNQEIDNCRLIKMKCQNECKTPKCNIKCIERYNECMREENEKDLGTFLYDLLSN